MHVLNVTEQISFRFKGTADDFVIPKGFVIEKGEKLSITAISGMGKTTLLTLLACLRKFQSGAISYSLRGLAYSVNDYNWNKIASPELWANIGFAFQRPELIRVLSVEENLKITLHDNLDDYIGYFFAEEEWEKIKAQHMWQLSGGQAQRVGLLRAFGDNQDLVFLDEPTNNLDVTNRDKIAEFINLKVKNKSVVIVSHDEEFLNQVQPDRACSVEFVEQRPNNVRQLCCNI